MRKRYKLAILALVLASMAHLVKVARTTYNQFAPHVTSKESIVNRNDGGLYLYDRHGRLFFTFDEAKTKQFVPLESIAPVMREATIAIEDKDFYRHWGFSIEGIGRSALVNLRQQKLLYGGSTITQQLVKNSLLSSRKSFSRKYKELVLAFILEARYTKDEILEMYLNTAYFGEGAFGVEQAARTYFNKSAKDLTLSESAMLAAVLPAPSELSPISGDKEYAHERQKLVLSAMVQQGYVSYEEARDAYHTSLAFRSEPQEINVKAPHFAIAVRDELYNMFGKDVVTVSGFRVKTSIDLDLQEDVQQLISDGVAKIRRHGAGNGAAVVMHPQTGEILAMVGSIDWHNDQFGKVNMALSPRQPGSSFKPIVYATAFETRRITPATILHDTPKTFGKDYRPVNYDGRFRGPILARRALVQSLNVPAVEVISKVGVDPVIRTANEVGITSLNDPNRFQYSLALGSGEVSLLQMVGAYATFANQGIHMPATAILEIRNKFEEVEYIADTEPQQVISPATAFLISSILSDQTTRTQVFGPSLNTTHNAAVKTGTTQSYRDNWTIGYTPSVAVGVWVGNNDNSPMRRLPGLEGAGPIWKAVMEHVTKDTPQLAFTPPRDVLALRVCRHNGLVFAGRGSIAYEEYFINGTEPSRRCTPPKPGPEEEEKKEDEDKKEEDKKEDKKEEDSETREVRRRGVNIVRAAEKEEDD